MEENEHTSNQTQLENKNYVIIQGKFDYGGRNKNYGLFKLIANGHQEQFIKVDTSLATQRELLEVNLKSLQEFDQTLKENNQEQPYQNKKIKLGLTNSFSASEISLLLNLKQDNNEEQIKNILKEKLEDMLQEQIKLKLNINLINKKQLKNEYPELFSDSTDSNQKEKSGEEKNTSQNKLNLDVTLNCNPIVSPVKGNKINELTIGDKLIVTINDNRDIGEYLKNLLHDEQEMTEGTITKINFNEDSQRYSVLIQFGPHVYGSLVVDSEIKLSSIQSNQEHKIEKETNKNIEINNNMFILIGLITIIIILVIVIISTFL